MIISGELWSLLKGLLWFGVPLIWAGYELYQVEKLRRNRVAEQKAGDTSR